MCHDDYRHPFYSHRMEFHASPRAFGDWWWACWVRPEYEWRRVADLPRGALSARWWHRVRWGRVALATGGLAWLWLWLLAGHRHTQSPSFRVSAPVHSALAPELSHRLRTHALADVHAACGFGAPQLRVYVAAVALWVHGELHVVVNPEYTPAPGAETRWLTETSPLCHAPDATATRPRADSVVAAFALADAPAERYHVTLLAAEAQCWQHWVDVFAGAWPCEDSAHVYDLLRLPRALPAPPPP